jgi:hypothetical protein
MKRYTDFEIWIDAPAVASPAPGSPASFPVRVATSLAGSAKGTLELNLGDATFNNELSVVRDMGPDLPSRRAFGQKLFAALFRDQVRDAWMTSRGRLAAGEADGLRLRLAIDDPQVAALPWELLHEDGAGFLGTAANVALSRYLPVPEPPAFTLRDKLRVLVVVESPSNLSAIEEQEVDALRAALDGLGSAVEHTILRDPAIPQIQSALQQDFHVLHFLGHGRAGKLALVRAGGTEAEFIADQEFAQVVQGRPSLRLVVLNACYSSQPAGGELFAGMGPALVRMQMPAVVAMQYNTVAVDTAGRFSRAFYGALANGIAVDFAVSEARQQLSAGPLLEQRDWSTPVLYMGSRQGRILVLPQQAAAQMDQAWRALQAAATVPDLGRLLAQLPSAVETQTLQQAVKELERKNEQAGAALVELTQRFGEVAQRQQGVSELHRLASHLGALRDAFEPCHAIVREAGFDLNRLIAQFAQLQALWSQMRDNQWAQVDTFIAQHPPSTAAPWHGALKDQIAAIDADFAGAAIGPLRQKITAFAGHLRQAEIQVRFQLERALDDLLQVSDRTLGRLTAL